MVVILNLNVAYKTQSISRMQFFSVWFSGLDPFFGLMDW